MTAILETQTGDQGEEKADFDPSSSRTVFSGSLGDVAVAELLQSLEMNRKSALIHFLTDRGPALVVMREGRLLAVEMGALRREVALNRLATVVEGSFVAEFRAPGSFRQDEISTPLAGLQGILMEAFRRLDERAKLLEDFPAPNLALLGGNERAMAEHPVLDADVRGLLELADGSHCLLDLLDASPWDDLDTLTRLVPLVRSKTLCADPRGTVVTREVKLRFGEDEQTVRPMRGRLWVVSLGTLLVASVASAAFVVGTRSEEAKMQPVWGDDTEFRAMDSEVVLAPVVPPLEPCPDGMVFVSGGKFFMGSQSEHPALRMALPAHRVEIDPYCIAVNETTVGAFRRCSEVGDCERAHRSSLWPQGKTKRSRWMHDREILSELCNENYEDRSSHPVNCVTWGQAAQYCEANGWELPTEAQWEFAARGSDGRVYPWGDDVPGPRFANACGMECAAWRAQVGLSDQPVMYEQDDGYAGTAPVGSFLDGRTEKGLYDMVGNVFEWTFDRYAAYDSGPAVNPQGAEDGERRTIRGGAFNSTMAAFSEPSLRFPMDQTAHSHGIGFRCASDPRFVPSDPLAGSPL